MRTRRLLALAGLLACAFAGAAAPAAVAKAASPSLLFVQQTDGGTLHRTGAGTYRLTLRGVAPSLTTFTDRPARAAGSESARRFVTRWPGRGFAADPPNAALVMDGAARDRDVVVLTLSHPAYHPRTRTFTYAAHPLRGTPGRALKGFAKRRDSVRELRFGAANLFIDDASDIGLTPLRLDLINVQRGAPLGIAIVYSAAGTGVTTAFSPAAGIVYGNADPGNGPVQSAEAIDTAVKQPVVTSSQATFSIDTNYNTSDDSGNGGPVWTVTVYFATDPRFDSFGLRDLGPMETRMWATFANGSTRTISKLESGTRFDFEDDLWDDQVDLGSINAPF